MPPEGRTVDRIGCGTAVPFSLGQSFQNLQGFSCSVYFMLVYLVLSVVFAGFDRTTAASSRELWCTTLEPQQMLVH